MRKFENVQHPLIFKECIGMSFNALAHPFVKNLCMVLVCNFFLDTSELKKYSLCMLCYHFNAGQYFFGLQGFFLVLGGPLSGLHEGEREIHEVSVFSRLS